MKKLFELAKILFGLRSEKAVDLGLVDYSGQGRDKYGR